MIVNKYKNSISYLFSLILIFVLYNNNLYSQKQSQSSSPTIERLTQWIKFLASDSLQGRAPATQGNYIAANFIEDIFKQNGLIAINDSYRQNFSFPHKVSLDGDNNVTFTRLIEKPGLPQDMWKPVDKQWKVMEDWIPLSFSENGYSLLLLYGFPFFFKFS